MCGGAGAQSAPAPAPQAPLDAPGVVSYALEHSPQILALRAVVAADESVYAHAHAAELPAIAGTLQTTLEKSENAAGIYSQYGVNPASQFSQNTAQIGASWNLPAGGAAQITAQEAKRALEAERNDLRRAEQQLAGTVAAAFYDLAARQETVRVAAGDLDYQKALLDAARSLEHAGRIAPVDTLRAQVNALRGQGRLVTAQADAANAEEALAQSIGAPATTAFAVPAAVPEPPLPAQPIEALIGIASTHRSDVLAARATLANATLANGLIDTDRYPQIQLTGAFGNSYSPTQGPIVPGGGNPGFWQFGVTSSLTLPLIEYGARRAAHAAAQAQITAAGAALSSVEYAVEYDIRRALRNAQTAAANLQTAKEAADLGRESVRIAQLQYRSGLISYTDASAAEQSAVEAAQELTAARVAYITAVIRLRVAVGADDPVAIVRDTAA
jgi:multidrug efflux system outer membrane protein